MAVFVTYTEHEDFFYDVELNFRRPICCGCLLSELDVVLEEDRLR